MPRSPRIHYAGARQHVMNRTARRRIVFVSPKHLELFKRLLAELPGRFGVVIHAWALMGNHFHLVVDVATGRLPEMMAWLTGQLARVINRENDWDGPLFKGRYRNVVVLDDAYFRDLIPYVHLNPVKARLVRNADDTAWSSHRFYAGLDPTPAWMTTADGLEAHGGAEEYRRYVQEVTEGKRQLAIDPARIWAPKHSEGVALLPPPPTVAPLVIADALEQVAVTTGIPAKDLTVCRPGASGNAPRNLAAWWLTRAATANRREVAEVLGMTTGAVGAAVFRVQHDRAQVGVWRDALMAEWWAPMEE